MGLTLAQWYIFILGSHVYQTATNFENNNWVIGDDSRDTQMIQLGFIIYIINKFSEGLRL